MARTDNDTWGLASSAEAVATGIAAGCALANRVANPPIEHPERRTRANDGLAVSKRAGMEPTQPTAWSVSACRKTHGWRGNQ